MSGHTPLPATPVELPLLPLRDVVVFPHMVIPLFVGRPKSIKALELAMESDRRIMLVAQKAAAKDEPSIADMFDVGCISTILQMLKLPDGTVKVLVEGTQRAHVDSIDARDEMFVATARPVFVKRTSGSRAKLPKICTEFIRYLLGSYLSCLTIRCLRTSSLIFNTRSISLISAGSASKLTKT